MRRKRSNWKFPSRGWGWGVLLGIIGGNVPPGSPNPDHISDQKIN